MGDIPADRQLMIAVVWPLGLPAHERRMIAIPLFARGPCTHLGPRWFASSDESTRMAGMTLGRRGSL